MKRVRASGEQGLVTISMSSQRTIDGLNSVSVTKCEYNNEHHIQK